MAISAGVLIRPSGIVARNRARFSGVSGTPMNSSSRFVAPITGQTAFTRILSGASSVAMHCVMMFTAPLLPLYQTSPGRGRMPAVLLTFTMLPPLPWRRNTGTAACAIQ